MAPLTSNRKRVLIDPSVQWALARRICLHWLAFFALVISINAILRVILDISEYSLAEACRRAFIDSLPGITIMLVTLPIFLRDTMRLSHRFVGPMYRIRKTLEMLSDGVSMPPIKFRKGDFWTEVATQLNNVRERCETLEVKVSRLKAENADLRKQLQVRDTIAMDEAPTRH